jgi:hypothetical protein
MKVYVINKSKMAAASKKYRIGENGVSGVA